MDRACRAFGLSPRTYRHRKQVAAGRLPKRAAKGPPQPRPVPRWTIPDAERERIRNILCEPRFCDLAPAQVYNTLLDEGVYVCSESTMYRILRVHDLSRERRRGHRRHHHTVPVLRATAPNQVWTWDISRLRGPALRCWFYLYIVLDLFSRKIVAWTIDTVESDKVARNLLHTACRREGINRDELTIHSDRGAQMTSHTIGELLESLGVTRSLSRPRTSNDNAFSEANFKTVKYRPDYPARFDSVDQARSWMRRFVHWYNHVHYHSAIGGLHPADVHDGTAIDTVNHRQAVLDHAYNNDPTRFRGRRPTAAQPPIAAWINKPTIHTQHANSPATTP